MPTKIKDPVYGAKVESFYNKWKKDYAYITFSKEEVLKFAHDFYDYMETGHWRRQDTEYTTEKKEENDSATI